MAAPIRWTMEAKGLVHRLWEGGVSSVEIARDVGVLLGCMVSVRAVVSQAAKAGSRRPSAFRIEQARVAGRLGGSVSMGRKLGPSAEFVHPVKAAELAAIARLDRPRAEHGNVFPTVRADPSSKGVPYTMASSRVDPFREARRRQAERGSVGRL